MAETTNPVFRRIAAATSDAYVVETATVTRAGVTWKAGVLLALLLGATFWSWTTFGAGRAHSADMGAAMMVALVGALGLGFYTSFRPQHAAVTAPAYAVFEGLLLGVVSSIFEARYPGLPQTAVLATVAVSVAMLVAYRTGLIQVTERFRAIVVGLTGGIAVFYLLAMVAGFFGLQVPFLVGGGALGIGFSLFVVGLAAANLALSFAQIDAAVDRAPRSFEWALAFGLIVTLVWLYLELLRLLSKRK